MKLLLVLPDTLSLVNQQEDFTRGLSDKNSSGDDLPSRVKDPHVTIAIFIVIFNVIINVCLLISWKSNPWTGCVWSSAERSGDKASMIPSIPSLSNDAGPSSRCNSKN